jgi:tetratricopeptide (TPR) repeat protein
MRVVLTPPIDWPPGLTVRIGPLGLLPDDLQAWIRQAMGGDLRGGAKLEIVSEREGTTETGWPLRLVEARVTEAGVARETRLGALYAFFEHGGSAIVGADAATLGAHAEAVIRLLRSARPDFSGEVTALSEVWDLDDLVVSAPAPAGSTPRANPRLFAEARLAHLGDAESPEAKLERAEILLELDRPADALAQLEGLALAPAGVCLRGRALAGLGRIEEAAAAWREAASADPTDAASRYNLGLVLFERGDFAGARAVWREAAAAAPQDFLLLRKIVQAEHRLELWDEAARTRAALRRLWRETPDPRARLVQEAVIDQFRVDGRRVFVYETFLPRDPSFHPVMRFAVVNDAGHELRLSVVIETSDYAKERGAPFVIVAWKDGKHRIVGTAAELPPYPRLRDTAIELLREAAVSPPSGQTPPTTGG